MKQLTKKLNVILIGSLLLISLALFSFNANKNTDGAIMKPNDIIDIK